MIRQIRVEGDLAYVPLTKGYTAIINAADVPLVCGFNWSAKVNRKNVYAKRAAWERGKRINILLHRVILAAPRDMQVDHRDGDGLNNRRSNLRLATHQQNAHNRRTPNTNTSGVKGVTWDKRDRKWQAKIMLGGRQRSLGFFTEKSDAAAAYAKASAQLHKEFGRTA